jgi:hypothetical protein
MDWDAPSQASANRHDGIMKRAKHIQVCTYIVDRGFYLFSRDGSTD